MNDNPTEPSGEILFEARGPVALITLNRPQARNALNDSMRLELLALLERVARDPGLRALVLTGSGKGFCAGGDIRGMRERLAAPPGEVAFNGWRRQAHIHHAISALHRLPKPTIAAVNGAAMGLGCDLALCCDFVLASEAASFAMSYILRGLIPDGGGVYFLPRRVGLARAKELIFSGRTLQAPEALALGMIERVAPADQMLEQALHWAGELAAAPAEALALVKASLNRSFEMSLEQVFAEGSQAQAICYTTDAHRSAVQAFLDRPGRKA
jgi:enoyl-CoA hydratase/carnithine racemase